jgi:hypothetical protein
MAMDDKPYWKRRLNPQTGEVKMIGRKLVIVAALALMSAVGLAGWLSGEDSTSVPLKGKWPKQGFRPAAIFDDTFEFTVVGGRIRFRCGDTLDGEARRIAYDKTTDVLTLEDVALEEGRKSPVLRSSIQVIVHPSRSRLRKSFDP